MTRLLGLTFAVLLLLTTQNNIGFAAGSGVTTPEQDKVMILKALKHLDGYLTVTKLKAEKVEKEANRSRATRAQVRRLCDAMKHLTTASSKSYGFVVGNEGGDLHLWLPSDSELESISATVHFASAQMEKDAAFCKDASAPVDLEPVQMSILGVIDQNTRLQDYVRYLMKIVPDLVKQNR